MAFDALKDVPDILRQRCLRDNEIIAECIKLGAEEGVVDESILDSLVLFKLIKKVGKGVYCDKDMEYTPVPIELSKAKQRTDDILFPETVKTPQQQVEYLLSPQSQLLVRPKTIEYSESQPFDTGRIIRDALKANVTFFTVNLAPVQNKNMAVSTKKDKRSGSFAVMVTATGELRIVVTGYFGERAERREVEKFFPSFEALVKFMQENI
jgi:hypothetical protein